MKLTVETLTQQLKKLVEKPGTAKHPAQKADARFTTRERRLALQKVVDELQAQETALNEWFIENLSKSEATGVAGKLARVQLGSKMIPQVEDWEVFYAHVKKTGEFELLQRRLSETAIKERLEAGKPVPGTKFFHAVTVSCTKI